MFKAGEKVGIQTLRKTYDNRVTEVLGSKLNKVREKRSQMWDVKEDLPSVEEYRNLKKARYLTNVETLVNDAYSEIENLASELRDWYDNMPEGFQQADKGSEVDEAASNLENIQVPDIPEQAGQVQVYYEPGMDVNSRSDRALEATNMLEAAKDALQEAVDNNEVVVEVEEGEDAVDKIETDFSEFEDLISTLENDIGEIEGVEFPGMY